MIKLAILAASASLFILGWDTAARAEDPVQPVDSHAPPCAGCAPAPPSPVQMSPALPDPPNARPGQCYAKVVTAPRFETYEDRVLVSEAHHEKRVIPSVYAWDEHPVMVEPEHIETHVVPATYRTVTETVMVREPSVRIEQVEPIYETVREQVVTRPAHQEWRRTFVGPDGLPIADDGAEPTGEMLCLVEVPAAYTTMERQVLRREGRTVEIQAPAEYRTVTRQVIDQPEHEVQTRIPAVYRMERFQRMVTPERVEYVDVPAEYRTVEKQRQVSGGTEEWRRVHCKPEPPAVPYGERG